MQTKPSSLLPILRSRALADILAVLFVTDALVSLSMLAKSIGVAPSTVKREVDQLERAGIVMTTRVGRNRIVTADRTSPFYVELRALMLKAFGPGAVLAESLAFVEGVAEAYIFGSWARRHAGERGPLPRDVDVLVVGDVLPDDVYRACREAERRLGIDVNPTIATKDEWRDSASPLLRTLRAEPLVSVGGS